VVYADYTIGYSKMIRSIKQLQAKDDIKIATKLGNLFFAIVELVKK